MRQGSGESVVFPQPAIGRRPSDRDICDSYLYLLGRLLVLRQEYFDLIDGAQWNVLVHREIGGSQHSNVEVACSEAWVAVDEVTYATIVLPPLVGRYYTVQLSNPWGEVIANLNERTFPQQPSGPFALCLKGAQLVLPPDTVRIDLPCRKARLLARIEIGADPGQASALQRQITLHASGKPQIPPTVKIPLFPNEKLPGVEVFDTSLAVLASEQDVNPEMDAMKAKVRLLATLVRDENERRRVDHVIHDRAWGLKDALFVESGDWVTLRVAGSYGADWRARTAANLFAIWSNTKTESVWFKAGMTTPLDGSRTYAMTFDKDDLPSSRVRYFWAVTCGDERWLGPHSPLRSGDDGSLTLYVAPIPPPGAPEGNWLRTPPGRSYMLTWRSYGPDLATVTGQWSPPPLQPIPRS